MTYVCRCSFTMRTQHMCIGSSSGTANRLQEKNRGLRSLTRQYWIANWLWLSGFKKMWGYYKGILPSASSVSRPPTTERPLPCGRAIALHQRNWTHLFIMSCWLYISMRGSVMVACHGWPQLGSESMVYFLYRKILSLTGRSLQSLTWGSWGILNKWSCSRNPTSDSLEPWNPPT